MLFFLTKITAFITMSIMSIMPIMLIMSIISIIFLLEEKYANTLNYSKLREKYVNTKQHSRLHKKYSNIIIFIFQENNSFNFDRTDPFNSYNTYLLKQCYDKQIDKTESINENKNEIIGTKNEINYNQLFLILLFLFLIIIRILLLIINKLYKYVIICVSIILLI